MKSRIPLAAVVLIGLLFIPAQSQPPAVTPPNLPPPVNVVAPSGRESSVEELLDMVEKLRAEKAELEKREANLTKQIQQKVGKQTERMKRLGITAPAELVPILK